MLEVLLLLDIYFHDHLLLHLKYKYLLVFHLLLHYECFFYMNLQNLHQIHLRFCTFNSNVTICTDYMFHNYYGLPLQYGANLHIYFLTLIRNSRYTFIIYLLSYIYSFPFRVVLNLNFFLLPKYLNIKFLY